MGVFKLMVARGVEKGKEIKKHKLPIIKQVMR